MDNKKVPDALATQRRARIRRWAPAGAALGLAAAVVATNLLFGHSTAAQVQMDTGAAQTQGFSVVSKDYPEDAPRPPATDSTGYCESDADSYAATDAVRQALTVNQSFLVIQDASTSKDKASVENTLTQSLDRSLVSLFAGDAAKQRKELYQESINNIDPAEFVALGGGISRMECRGAIAAPNGYTIRVTATAWAVFSSKMEAGSTAYANPVGPLEATAVVDKENHLTSLTIEVPEGDGHP